MQRESNHPEVADAWCEPKTDGVAILKKALFMTGL